MREPSIVSRDSKLTVENVKLLAYTSAAREILEGITVGIFILSVTIKAKNMLSFSAIEFLPKTVHFYDFVNQLLNIR